MRIELIPDFRAHALAGLGGEPLAYQRGAQADDIEQHENAAHFKHVALIAVFYADIDDLGHDDGDNQLKNCLDELEKRPQKNLLFKVF